jgi:hypothetical protein
MSTRRRERPPSTPRGGRSPVTPDGGKPPLTWVKGAQMRSCSSVVLMEESAEQVASTHGAPIILGAAGRPGQRIWWSQPECPVRTVAVVMLDIDPEDLVQVAAANDQQPVQAVGYGNAFMQLVGTRAGDRRAGRVGGPGVAGGH